MLLALGAGYPTGHSLTQARASDRWLLVEAPAIAASLAAGAGGRVAESIALLPDRWAVRVEGLPPGLLEAAADRLRRSGQAAWVALERGGGVAFSDDRLVARFDRWPTPTELAALGVVPLASTPQPDTFVLRALDGDGLGAAWRVTEAPGVRWAEPDLIRHLQLAQIDPGELLDDPRAGDQWHLRQIGVPEAWAAYGAGSPDIVVAVFDTGIDLDHPDLVDRIVGGFDVDDPELPPEAGCTAQRDGAGPAPSCPPERPYRESHGTAVAGVAVATGGNGVGGVGICPRCSLFPVRILPASGARSSGVAAAFRRAAQAGVDVINNSWGPGLSRFFPLSMIEREALRFVSHNGRDGLGTVIVFAAGNSFTPAASNPYASHPDVIAVSASTRLDDFACYSSFGEVISVAAPSLGCFEGESGVVTADLVGPEGYDAGDTTGRFSGTSAAAPMVSGLAGLVLSANPDLTAQQVRWIIEVTADRIEANQNPWAARGLDLAATFAYDDRHHSRGFGYGRINAPAAVALAVAVGEGAVLLGPDPRIGGVCDGRCPRCLDARCAPDCDDDAACPGAWRCLPTGDGGRACQRPAVARDAPGSFCSADCPLCVHTLDSALGEVSICTDPCEDDEGCPFGFDCRSIDHRGRRACVPGNADCGQAWGDGRCLSGLRLDAGDRSVCTCECAPGTEGSCPRGFLCQAVTCARESEQVVRCQRPAFGQGPNYQACVPDPGFERPCEEDADCDQGRFCLRGRCRADTEPGGCDVCVRCDTDVDCAQPGDRCVQVAEGRRCLADACDRGCPGASECRDLGAAGRLCAGPGEGDEGGGICPPAWRCRVEDRCRDDLPCSDPLERCVAGRCAAIPDAAIPDAAIPDAAIPDAAILDTAIPDTLPSDTGGDLDSTRPADTGLPDASPRPDLLRDAHPAGELGEGDGEGALSGRGDGALGVPRRPGGCRQSSAPAAPALLIALLGLVIWRRQVRP